MIIWIKIKALLNVKFLFRNILIPIALLAIYTSSFAFISSRFLPKGVNYDFTSRIVKYILVTLVVVILFTGVIYKRNKNTGIELTNYLYEKIHTSDIFLLLVPLTLVSQYIISNLSTLSLINILLIFVFFTFFSSIYIYGIPALLGFISSTRNLMALGLAFVCVIISMAMVSKELNWYQDGSLKTIALFFCFLLVVSVILIIYFNRKYIPIVLMVFFIANTSIQLFSKLSNMDNQSLSLNDNKLYSLTDSRIPEILPNMYLLIYDSYAPNETMMGYGINNYSQEEYLINQGFEIYPHVYTIAIPTINSISRVLNITKEWSENDRIAVSGDGLVQNYFRYLGYKTFGIFPSDYEFRGIGSSYDVSYPQEKTVTPHRLLISAILIGEFRFDLGFYEQTYGEFIETKQEILRESSSDQVFVYTHTYLPGHSQYSGKCRSNETEIFESKLSRANVEMRQDIAEIIENDENAIIVIAGDHGPLLTKNCTFTTGVYDSSEISRLDIQDRYGVFLAIRWPTTDYTKYDDIKVLQDIFPAIFSYMYKDPMFLTLKVVPEIQDPERISGVSVRNGFIIGGINDGEELFILDD